MTQLITALVSIHSSMTFLADMYSFIDPPSRTVLFSVDDRSLFPVDCVIGLTVWLWFMIILVVSIYQPNEVISWNVTEVHLQLRHVVQNRSPSRPDRTKRLERRGVARVSTRRFFEHSSSGWEFRWTRLTVILSHCSFNAAGPPLWIYFSGDPVFQGESWRSSGWEILHAQGRINRWFNPQGHYFPFPYSYLSSLSPLFFIHIHIQQLFLLRPLQSDRWRITEVI